MAVSTDELETLRDSLIRARARGGMRSYEIEGQKVEFRSDAEIANAIADLDRRIAAAASTRPSKIAFSSSKRL